MYLVILYLFTKYLLMLLDVAPIAAVLLSQSPLRTEALLYSCLLPESRGAAKRLCETKSALWPKNPTARNPRKRKFESNVASVSHSLASIVSV
jgi:hypothetical protein